MVRAPPLAFCHKASENLAACHMCGLGWDFSGEAGGGAGGAARLEIMGVYAGCYLATVEDGGGQAERALPCIS